RHDAYVPTHANAVEHVRVGGIRTARSIHLRPPGGEADAGSEIECVRQIARTLGACAEKCGRYGVGVAWKRQSIISCLALRPPVPPVKPIHPWPVTELICRAMLPATSRKSS